MPSWIFPAGISFRPSEEDRLRLAFVEADCVGLGPFSCGCGTGLEFGCHFLDIFTGATQATFTNYTFFLNFFFNFIILYSAVLGHDSYKLYIMQYDT